MARRLLTDLGAAALLALVATFLFRALLSPVAYWSHELAWPAMRLAEYVAQFRNGVVPPQVFADALGGAGYAFPRMYPPLGNYVAAGMAVLTGDLVRGVHLSLLLSVVLSGWALYAAAVTMSAGRAAALVGALCYLVLPYRFVNVFVRGAMAEAWVFVWFPLVLAGAWATLERRRLVWWFPLVIAALILSHAVMALWVVVTCAGLGALAWRQWTPAGVRWLAVSGGVGVSLAAWYLVPMRALQPWLWVSDRAAMWATPAQAAGHIVLLRELFQHDPRYWFGGSGAGAAPGLSTELGVAQWIGVPLATALAWWAWRSGRLPRDDVRPRLAAWLVAAWAVLLAFMVTPGIWYALPASLVYLQFPYRLLVFQGGLAMLALALLLGAARLPRAGWWVVGGAVTVLMLATPPHWQRVRYMPGWTAAGLAAGGDTTARKGIAHTAVGEYLPRTMPLDSVAARVARAPRLEGAGSVGAWTRAGAVWRVAASAVDSARVILPLVYYPFYAVDPGDRVRLPTHDIGGLLAVAVPPGAHVLTVRVGADGPMQAGMALTLLGLLAWVAAVAGGWQRRRKAVARAS